MSQLPINLFHEFTLKKPRGQQAYWDIIRVLGANENKFTLPDVLARIDDHSSSVRDYIKRLVKGKYLKKTHKGLAYRTPDKYILLKPVIVAPSVRHDGSEVPPTLNSELWLAMRMSKIFDAQSLLEIVPNDGALTTVKSYVKALNKAGYLALVKKHTHLQTAQYRLMKDTGPLAPQIQNCKMVWDANLCEVMGQPEFKEVAA